MLAPSIRIHRPIEGDIGGLRHLIDDALRAVEKHLALDAVGSAILALPLDPLPVQLLPQHMQPHAFKPVAWVQPRSLARCAGPWASPSR